MKGNMGTNFYWAKKPKKADSMDPEWHIGKRSAAGLYCWDCKRTLCRDGEARIHYSGGRGNTLMANGTADEWLKACPECGKKYTPRKDMPTAAAVELVFASARAGQPVGVHSCCSFSWAQPPLDVMTRCHRAGKRKCVEDEYGQKMSGIEFLDMLQANCPVRYTNSIGVCFS